MAGAFTTLIVFAAILVAIGAVVAAGWRAWTAETVQGKAIQGGGALVVGAVVFMLCLFLASYRPVPTGQVAVIDKKMFGDSLSGGRIIATNGEMGIQDEILRDGWHSGYLPFIYELEYRDLLDVPKGSVAIISTKDGVTLPDGQFFAPTWDNTGELLDAETFLAARSGDNIGYKGEQASVLLPGKYAYNFAVYDIEIVQAASIAAGQVGVIKSNIGEMAPDSDENNGIVPRGFRGIWNQTYPPGIVPLNPRAFETIKVPTTVNIVDYTSSEDNNDEFTQASLESMIDVKTSDGFKFPVEVRIEYRIEPANAPSVVAFFYDERDKSIGRKMRQKMNSTVRSVFRNNAERAGALQYVNDRSGQERSCFDLITAQMQPFGITITKVAIGDIDPDETSEELAALLKTQTDKQIALQQEQTFVQQQAAAREEQKLNDEQQRAIEAKRLATAEFDAQIAEQTAARAEREAEGRAKAVRVEAEADAFAILQRTEAEAAGVLALQRAEAQGYLEKAQAVGGSNLAMIELFERIASGQIDITPNIVVGEGGGGVSNALGAMFLQRMQSGEPLLNLGVPQAPPAETPAQTETVDSGS